MHSEKLLADHMADAERSVYESECKNKKRKDDHMQELRAESSEKSRYKAHILVTNLM